MELLLQRLSDDLNLETTEVIPPQPERVLHRVLVRAELLLGISLGTENYRIKYM